ncbi:MAG: MmgE/PrpD family protein [Gammaproteobacteria bacterium]|nr:MmgE/PrpD family protein [Gammaproteobacteria bacterium]
MSATMRLAQRIAGARFDEIPANAVEVGKQALMDFIGVTVAGAHEPLANILVDEAEHEGGHPQAQLIGRATKATASQAALINGSAGHAHDYDDVHNAMSGHPTVPVAPTALALAECLGKSGRDLITAFCAGVDAECILGRYAGPAHYARGWHATGTLGSFGAAAAAAHLKGLDAETTARALGIAGTQAAGLKSQFGTMCKPLHAGHAAATGLQAANLAARGFTSRSDILETEQGFMATQSESADLARFDSALAKQAFTQDICFKYHAACYLTHSSIEATNNLCSKNAFDPNDIVAVDIEVDEGHLRVCNIQEPQTGLEAKFSLRFTAAMALAGIDTSSIEIYTDELTRDPTLVGFRDKVTVSAHEARNPDSIVTIRTKDGADHVDAFNVAIPMTDLDAQWQKLETKFHALVDPRLGTRQAQAIVAACHALEDMDELNEFFPELAEH